jgi:20S proteasome subunit alpha 3
VEFATLTVDPVTKKPKLKIYRPAGVDTLLKKHDLVKKDEDAEMKIA